MLKINKPPGGLDREFTVDGPIAPKIRKKRVRELFYSQNANTLVHLSSIKSLQVTVEFALNFM